jgi:hypothetical protein
MDVIKSKGVIEAKRWRNVVLNEEQLKKFNKQNQPDIMIKIRIEYVHESKYYVR